MTTQGSTDRIEKRVTLNAPQAKVWRAISDAEQFGAWFGVQLEGSFVEGEWISGRVTYEGMEGVPFSMLIERLNPESEFAYRWHPFAIDPNVDYSDQPMTLVVFSLDRDGDLTNLTITESGFDALPEVRREEAYRANDGGWAEQATRIKAYVEE